MKSFIKNKVALLIVDNTGDVRCRKERQTIRCHKNKNRNKIRH